MIESRVFTDVLIEGLDDYVPTDQFIWVAKEETTLTALLGDSGWAAASGSPIRQQEMTLPDR
ncbi:hypothetical protein ACFUMJ_30885 [Streptomyces olivaceus]|uniref:hypothetical protein n=1 Tax=Streptomyces TaxID=1883 RepID=UPI001FB6236B|nr:hypothetical protein [Streptomyces sp. CB09030]UOG82998.1 hypothetical protein L6J92_29130 [Streptomyces sp. CB09030]